jgi:HEAT repeat protein
MRVRYLALGPLGELARGGDGAAARRIGDALARDPEWPVRARAAEQASGLPAVQTALLAAARDAEPRVREAALQSLAESADPAAVQAASTTLATDGWSFVKAQAVSVLAHAAPSAGIDQSLRDALRDTSVRVRAVAVHAVALRHTRDLHDALRERLDDRDEEPEVRAAAAAALGAVCDASSVDRLTELAGMLGVPGTAEDDQQIALGALVGLAAIHPADLRGRLSRLLGPNSPPYVRAAAAKALAAPGVCH